MQYFNYKKYKLFIFYVVGFISLTILIYLTIPFFYDYGQFQERLQNKILSNFNLKINIKGDVRYTFIPSPRLKIQKVNFIDFLNDEKIISEAEEVVFNIPFKNLASLKKLDFDKINIKNSEININLDEIKNYYQFFKNFNSKPIYILDSKINFYSKKKYVASIDKVNIEHLTSKLYKKTILEGNFLSNTLNIHLENKLHLSTPLNILKVKFKNLGILANINFANKNGGQDGKTQLIFKGNDTTFDYFNKNNVINLTKGKIKNNFFVGKFDGDLSYYPFFTADLNLDLSRLNFNNLYRFISSIGEDLENHFLQLNKKINGNLNLNIHNVYSRSKLITSAETSIEFINGDIVLHKLLLNLGKLGASDIVGEINNDAKFNTLKFKQNIYIDDLKFFRRKFGLNNIKNANFQSLHISGVINLKTKKISFEEIFINKNVNDEDKQFIEDNFNLILFNDDYKSFFNFVSLKQFLQLVLETQN